MCLGTLLSQKYLRSGPPHVCLSVMVHMGSHCLKSSSPGHHVHMAVAAHVDHNKQTNMWRFLNKRAVGRTEGPVARRLWRRWHLPGSTQSHPFSPPRVRALLQTSIDTSDHSKSSIFDRFSIESDLIAQPWAQCT